MSAQAQHRAARTRGWIANHADALELIDATGRKLNSDGRMLLVVFDATGDAIERAFANDLGELPTPIHACLPVPVREHVNAGFIYGDSDRRIFTDSQFFAFAKATGDERVIDWLRQRGWLR